MLFFHYIEEGQEFDTTEETETETETEETETEETETVESASSRKSTNYI